MRMENSNFFEETITLFCLGSGGVTRISVQGGEE